MPQTEFWELLGKLYEVHDAFRKCVPYPAAAEICKEIEQLVMDLQQRFTMPQPFDMEKYAGERGGLIWRQRASGTSKDG